MRQYAIDAVVTMVGFGVVTALINTLLLARTASSTHDTSFANSTNDFSAFRSLSSDKPFHGSSPPPNVTQPFRILFVGNSFTYGPPPYNRANQSVLNNLPRFFKFVAESMGRPVLVAEDTIGGCTLYIHRPSINPEACRTQGEGATCQLVTNERVDSSERCTTIKELGLNSPHERPCPETFMRQPYSGWDAVVLQDYSILPTVQNARERMLFPSVQEFASVAKSQARRPVVAAYMTWSYVEGSALGVRGNSHCPGGKTKGCFPLGSLTELTTPTCHSYDRLVQTVPCMSYALARAYAETVEHGADVVVPAGLAWLAARGAPAIPASCREAIDAEYANGAGRLSQLDLPLRAGNAADARWNDSKSALGLFRDKGPAYKSKYCSKDCHVDHHPSEIGIYLNALVFYATLLKQSPIGAAWPDGTQEVDGMKLPAIEAEDAKALQRIAHDVVMDHLDVWWSDKSGESLDIFV